LLRPEYDHIHSGLLQDLDHFFAASLCEVVRGKSAIPNDHAHRHLSFVRHGPFRDSPEARRSFDAK
jgi:hypothetical protein